MRIFRVLKGVVVSAVTWGVAWVPLTVGLTAITATFGGRLPPSQYWGQILLSEAVTGAVSGAAFGLALSLLGRNRDVATLSGWRMALSGAIGSVVFPAIVWGIILGAQTLPISTAQLALMLGMRATLGALLATASLRIARRAPQISAGASSDPQLIESGAA